MSPQDQARDLAAQIWTRPGTSHIEFDAALAEVIALEVQPLLEEIERLKERAFDLYGEASMALVARNSEQQRAEAAERRVKELDAELQERISPESLRALIARCRELEAERDAERNLAELTRRDHHRLVCEICDGLNVRLSEAQAKLREDRPLGFPR